MLSLAQHDSYIQEHTTRIVSCVPTKKPKKSFDLILEETIFFPEDGGQLADGGEINGARIVALRKGTDAEERPVIIHTVGRAFEPGTSAHLRVDWARRFDLMQHHTAQHLITALAVDHFGWETTSWALCPAGPCSVDVSPREGAAPPDADSLAALEARVNDAVREARSIRIHICEVADLASVAASVPVRSRGIPENVDKIRLVEIDQIDCNTCCGTHLRSTSELQVVKLFGFEKARADVYRLIFTTGSRALQAFGEMVERERALKKLFSSAPQSFEKKVKQLQDDLRKSSQKRRALNTELASYLAAGLVSQCEGGVRLIGLHREGEPDPDLVALVVSATLERVPEARLFITQGDAHGGSFLLSASDSDAAWVRAAGATAARLMGGKGGGKQGKFQGRSTQPLTPNRHTAVLEALRAEARMHQ